MYEKKNIVRPCICRDCYNKLSPVKQPACLKCGKQLDDEEKELCHDCSVKDFDYTRGLGAFSYSKEIKASMYAFKYNNRREYASYYARTIYENYNHIISSWNPQVLIPVPLHPSKYRKRGYNQAEILADRIGEFCNIPVDTNSLFRIRKTKPQKELNDKERNNNIENAFQSPSNGVKYKNIVLVDDIYTTGTTINECAKVMKSAGADNIYFLVVCIGRGF